MLQTLKKVEEKLPKIETEGSWKIRQGSYYYVENDDWKSGGLEDDYFKDFVFPHSHIEHSQCACDTKDCKTEVSCVFLLSGCLITDRENLVRVVGS